MLELFYPEDKSYVVPTGIGELIGIKTASEGNAELKADEKTMTNICDSTCCDNFQMSNERSFVLYKEEKSCWNTIEWKTYK